jgi:outer membrane protein OmpA-like peptidoglycan-associated protein
MKRPVLTFADFLIESARMINEGYSFSQAKEILSQYIKASTVSEDSQFKSNIKTITTTQLAAIEKMAEGVSEEVVKALGDALGNMLNVSLENEKMELNVADTEICIDRVLINNVVAGRVFCDKVPATSVKTVEVTDNKVSLEGILTGINLYNAEARKDKKYWTQKKEGADLDFVYLGKKDSAVPNADSDNQIYITNGDAKLEWKKNTSTNTITPLSGFAATSIAYSSDDALRVDLTLYGVEAVLKGKGGSVSVSEIVPITIKKGGGTTEKAVDIQDNGTLFVKAKSELLEDGKRNIFNAIQTNFTSVTSVEVVGGASKEGDEAFNKKLCLDRAGSVVEFLKTLIPGASITASKETNIQPLESTEDLKTWRKVTLNVTGTLSAVEPASDVIQYVAQNKTIAADQYRLYQITLSFYAVLDQENK